MGEVARARRLLLVEAGPGYGKTRRLRTTLGRYQHWVPPAGVAALAGGTMPAVPAALSPPPAVPAALSPPRAVPAALSPPSAGPPAPAWLVLDDVPRLDPAALAEVRRWLANRPDDVGVALTTRWPLAAVPGPATDVERIGPAGLRLTVAEVAAILRDDFGLADPELAGFLHEATSGWPALVQLAGATLAAAPPAVAGVAGIVAALTRPGTPLAGYILDEVLPSLGGAATPARRLLRDLAGLTALSAGLGQALGYRGAARILAELSAVGVLCARPDPLADNDSGGELRVVPVVAALAGAGTTPARRRANAQAAAGWYAEHGPPLAAAKAHLDAAQPGAGAVVLTEHGEEILAGGGAQAFVELVDRLPVELRSWRVRLLWADADRTIGDIDAAQSRFAELAQSTPDGHGYPPELAWRMGLVHYLKAEPRAALEVFARADLSTGSAGDRAQVLAWTATAYWMLGEAEPAARYAGDALRLATEAGEPRALVGAHVAMAMSRGLGGDPPGEHYATALRGARELGDIVQATRILINETDHLLARARYDEALATARRAGRAAGAGAPPGMVIVALCNEGEALGRLGFGDESIDRFARATSMCRRLGIRRAAAAAVGAAEVHRRLGWPREARAGFEEAARLARGTGEMQALVPALVGLSLVLARDEPTRAEALAMEAAESAQGPWLLRVYLAEGWAALYRGELTVAVALARQAVEEARLLDEPARLAEALELTAATLTEPEATVPVLREAHRIWHDGGAAIDADRITVTLGGLPGADRDARAAAMLARHRLVAAGVRPAAMTVPLTTARPVDRDVRIRILGRFDVVVDGRPVPGSAWQSRKARDLLRILVARRGRLIAREELAELLWPGEEVARTSHRLSVLLSIVRTVLSADSADRSASPVLLADRAAVALDPSSVRVDVDDFLAEVTHGCGLYEQGHTGAARSLLRAALTGYGGDPFDDEPYADWTIPVREHVRWAYLRAHRTLAHLARRAGDPDDATGHLLAILECDPFDEEAHQLLIRTLTEAGRHGEAARATARYQSALRTLALPP